MSFKNCSRLVLRLRMAILHIAKSGLTYSCFPPSAFVAGLQNGGERLGVIKSAFS